MTKADELISLTEAQVVLLTAQDNLMRTCEYFRAVIEGAESIDKEWAKMISDPLTNAEIHIRGAGFIIDKLQDKVSEEVKALNAELDKMEEDAWRCVQTIS